MFKTAAALIASTVAGNPYLEVRESLRDISMAEYNDLYLFYRFDDGEDSFTDHNCQLQKAFHNRADADDWYDRHNGHTKGIFRNGDGVVVSNHNGWEADCYIMAISDQQNHELRVAQRDGHADSQKQMDALRADFDKFRENIHVTVSQSDLETSKAASVSVTTASLIGVAAGAVGGVAATLLIKNQFKNTDSDFTNMA